MLIRFWILYSAALLRLEIDQRVTCYRFEGLYVTSDQNLEYLKSKFYSNRSQDRKSVWTKPHQVSSPTFFHKKREGFLIFW